MNSSAEHRSGSRYFVIKSHQWRGNLRRLLVIEAQNVATYEPSDYKLTNIYPCHEIKEFGPLATTNESDDPNMTTVTTGADQAFLISFPNAKMKFRSKYRADILTDLFRVCVNVSPRYSDGVKRYTNVMKQRWSGETYRIILEVGVYGVNKINAKTNRVMSTYLYKDIYRLIPVKECETPGGAFVISTTENERYHLFVAPDEPTLREIMEKIRQVARKNIGVVIPVSGEPITHQHFRENMFGVPMALMAIPIHVFTVHKINAAGAVGGVEESKKITLAFTDHCLLERDLSTNGVMNVRFLAEVYAIARPKDHSQKFAVLYLNGDSRYYTSTERDSLLSSFLDSVRSSGNANVFMKLDFYHHKVIAQPEIEVARFLNSRNKDLVPAMEFFVENNFFSNIVMETGRKDRKDHEKFIHLAINELLFEELCDVQLEEFNLKLLVLKNLFSTKPGFSYFIVDRKYRSAEIEQLFKKVKKAFDKENDVVIFTAIDMLSTLMQPVHDQNDLFFEQKNKGFLLSSKNFLPIILDLMKFHIDKGTGALIIAGILDFMTFALCAPYSETTDGGHFDMLLNLISEYGRSLFRLFDHQSLSIVKATCLLMKAIIEEGNPKIAAEMQKLALAEGTFLFHLNASLYPVVTREKFLPIQILSRKLISLWTVNNETAMTLMYNIFPLGLLNYFESEDAPPANALIDLNLRDNLKIAQDLSSKPVSQLQKIRDQYASVRVFERHLESAFNHWRKKIGIAANGEPPQGDQPVLLRRRREFIKSTLNWNLFFYQFTQNHAKPDLIWNHKTREELREALEREIAFLKNEKELSSYQLLSWNFYEFQVWYPSLDAELKIGDYYLRLLLARENQLNDRDLYIKCPVQFFNELYHRFLSNSNLAMKTDCLQAMSIIYDKYHEEIGAFNDIAFIVNILDGCTNRTLRDRIVHFIGKLIKEKTNIKQLIRCGGLFILIDLATLSHLHVNRAVVPTQTNVIEASAEMMRDGEKEWHISKDEAVSFADLKQMWAEGKITSETKCWAQGYNAWKRLADIAQLKWTIVADGLAIFQENNMTIYILDTLIRICEAYPSRAADNSIIRPIPRVKQILSDESCLPHLVHLLLTFDPILVEKVATLLHLIMQDNPRISLLYQTGLFYFILMYTGSNILPVSRLLQLAHMKQSFKSADDGSNSNSVQSVLQRSILSQMLPEAMVCYLENYGPEEFSKVFLGEFDTPEVIWNHEMRRFMIEKISAHIVDFSPRLHSNVRAIYQYCPIPPVRYQQLENELFCDIYYLKNLCDTKRFGDWKIKDPVNLLRNILEMWKLEMEKKPNSMQVEDALDILGIKDYDGQLKGPEFESLIRKRYYAQAQRYHPDKNADGREMFEKVNEAYYFLFSARHKSNGPEVQNIILILKAQSILFSRHNVELYQYKYAGYPMLLKTLLLELNDQYLFSKTDSLLAHACKTVYYTVKCSALNAEELRREEGLQMLYDILNRCVSVLSVSATAKDLATKVCKHIISTFGVSAEFSACRTLFYDMTSLAKNIFYVLNYKHLTRLCMAAIDCVIYFCNDPYLQLLLFRAGCLFSLVQFVFKYDYTLEENDFEATEKNNKQYVDNSLAKKALSACVALFENRFDRAQVEDKSLLDDYSLIRQAIYALLTPYIANQLNMANVPELLKLINSNIENPYFIWNNASRAELLNYLQTQERELLRSGVCLDESFGSQFVYSCHKEELIVSDIFVRIYNKQPNYPLTNVRKFVLALLDQIGTHAQYLHAVNAISFPIKEGCVIDQNRINTIEQCLTALINLLNYNAGIETCFVGHFRNIFSLLRLDTQPRIQKLVLKLLLKLSTNKECIQDISNSNVFINLAMMLHVPTRITEAAALPYLDILEILLSFTTNSDLIKESISKGILLYLLYLFIMPNHAAVREKAAQVLVKIGTDALNGQYTNWVVTQFLPGLFLNAMKDAPQNAINLYDENKENPELIWTEETRQNLNQHIKMLLDRLYVIQQSNPMHTWKFNADCELKSAAINDEREFKISGVYLRLYNKSPGWILSRPKDFLLSLLEYAKNVCEKTETDETKVEMINTALHVLLSTQSDLLVLIPATGYIQIFVNRLESDDPLVAKTCLLLIQKFSLNSACLNDLLGTDRLARNLNAVLENHNAALIEPLCDTMVKIFESKDARCEEFINQAIKCGLMQNLLKVLDSNASQSTKAKIVQMFQTILESEYGDLITELLNASNIWKDYKDQKHDLFLTNSNSIDRLTSSSVNIAGYLKQSSGRTLPLVPPPIEE